jgi:hypothetical protein
MRRLSIQPLTWKWLEREIARRIQRQSNAKAFSQLLAKQLKAGSGPRRAAKRKTLKEH